MKKYGKKAASLLLGLLLVCSSACAAQTAETAATSAAATTTAAETEETTEATTTTAETSAEATETTTTATEAETSEAAAETTATTEQTADTTEKATEAARTTTSAETTTAAKTEKTTTAPKETTTTVKSEKTTTAPKETTTTVKTEKTTTAPKETTTAAKEEEMTQENERKVIALTFDDGPNTTTTNEVLDVLEKYGIKASFFLIGNNIDDESAKAVKRAYGMGCEIGNHSRSHSYMDKLTAEEIDEEVTYVNEKVIEITGEAPTFFRPPYIAVNDTMFETIEMPFIAGYGANDWEDRVTAERRAMMVLKQAKNGAIILLHDAKGNSKTVEALDTIIPELQAQGYEFVTISEVFRECGAEPKANDRRIYSFAEQTTMYG